MCRAACTVRVYVYRVLLQHLTSQTNARMDHERKWKQEIILTLPRSIKIAIVRNSEFGCSPESIPRFVFEVFSDTRNINAIQYSISLYQAPCPWRPIKQQQQSRHHQRPLRLLDTVSHSCYLLPHETLNIRYHVDNNERFVSCLFYEYFSRQIPSLFVDH